MKVIDRIKEVGGSNKNPQFSFEIVPPPRGRSVQDIIDIVESLQPLKPAWIDVTSHASSAYFQEKADGTVRKKTLRKRPGAIGICGVIQNRFRIDTVAHVLCQGFSREETEDALIELSFLGIENVLALKGDSPNYAKSIDKNKSLNTYASDLVKQIAELRKGKYLEEISGSQALNFCVGVAGYPEKHFEAANMKTDLKWLKHKVDQGADYIISQMFFDNQKFYDFVKSCREVGIKVPIIPGIKVLKSAAQLKTIPKTFHIDLPDELVDQVLSNPEDAEAVGLKWAGKQIEDLLKNEFLNLHIYVLNDAPAVSRMLRKFV